MSGNGTPDLILTNARVLTMDRQRPVAREVAVKDSRILWVSSEPQPTVRNSPDVKLVDCGGGLLLPGFNDSHIHLLSYASSALAVDCRPACVSSIHDIKREIGRKAMRTRQGEWIRAWGYDETSLQDRRHPTRRDLDEATRQHPVRLDHRSGHACVLNSLALERVGIGESFSEPSGATVGRDLDTGSPSGLLMEMQDFLDGKTSSHSEDEMAASIENVSSSLLAQGVTSVQDATEYNSVSRWDYFTRARKRVVKMPRISLMPGYRNISDFTERGLAYGSGNAVQRVGPVKIMVTMSSGRMTPDKIELSHMVRECVEMGFPVAIHAVEAEAVSSAAEAIMSVSGVVGLGGPHRIEHASECPPEALRAVSQSSAMVATQPGFILRNGDRYMSTVEEAMLPYLYRIRALKENGISVAFGSDAPMGEPDPMLGISSAVTRKTEAGRTLSREERIGVLDALRAYTSVSAGAAGLQGEVGKIKPGMLADMVLFDEDITLSRLESIGTVQPVMTIMGGDVVSES